MALRQNGEKRILVLNGPNLNLLGSREPEQYGNATLLDLEDFVGSYANSLGVRVTFMQANAEGELIDAIHAARFEADGIVFNPGAFTHYSYALRDAVSAVALPTVEVHLSDIDDREPFRRVSVIAPVCVAQVRGMGFQGYCTAIDLLLSGLTRRLAEGRKVLPTNGKVLVAPEASAGSGKAQQCADLADFAAMADGPGSHDAPSAGAGARSMQESALPGGFRGVFARRERRLERMREAMRREGLDAFLVSDTENIRWLLAVEGVFDTEQAHMLLITPDKAAVHTDSRYSSALRRALAEFDEDRADVPRGSASGASVRVDDSVQSHASYAACFLQGGDAEPADIAPGLEERRPAMQDEGARRNESSASDASLLLLRVGIENSMTLARYRSLEQSLCETGIACLQETASFVLSLRAVKDAFELECMKAAQAITDAAFEHIVAYLQPGMTERQAQQELDRFMLEQGADGLAFATIMASGANGANPHAVPGGSLLEKGQCVVIDFGCRYSGYCSDMTRTVFLGAPSERMLAAWQILCRANEAVQKALRPGVTGKQMQELAESVLEEGGFGGLMGHGLGHGVGVEVHEMPNLNRRNDEPLQVGNVVTVEPGIYIEGEFGMRLEDFGVIGLDGFEVFTQSTHEIVIIKQFD